MNMVGKRIKELREKLGISQTDLAIKIGESKQTLYKYENGIITNIPSDKIEIIAEILGCSPAYLMGWSDKVIDYYKYTDAEQREQIENNPQLREVISLFLNGSDADRETYLRILRGLQQNP